MSIVRGYTATVSVEVDLHVRHRRVEKPRGTLVYIHGLGDSGLCFEGLMTHPRLAEWSHVAPDLAGYGKSAWPEPPARLIAHAERMRPFLINEHARPVVLVGHSMGGVIGTLLCEDLPGLPDAFINVEGNVSPDDCRFSARFASFSDREYLPHGLAKTLDDLYRNGLEQPALRGYYAGLRMCDPRALRINSQELVTLSETEKLAERLAKTRVPCTYILGSPNGTGERSQQLLKQAGIPVRPVENAGHWPFLDQPDAFLDQMLDFLNTL